ncbi:hypothetical protein PUN28_000160 [Cardiocondyla obscurior]|uniref:Uncharacterized protein n=1 Tax=Cardiocondyla obscurior TaxID=286306 RepID=A0AAW2GY13_9HYME
MIAAFTSRRSSVSTFRYAVLPRKRAGESAGYWRRFVLRGKGETESSRECKGSSSKQPHNYCVTVALGGKASISVRPTVFSPSRTAINSFGTRTSISTWLFHRNMKRPSVRNFPRVCTRTRRE